MADTIVALATPPGRSGIGIIRLSGETAAAIAGELADTDLSELEPRRARLAKLRDPRGGEAIDTAVITFFKAPNSFTGEDVVEISCHGSPIVLRLVIDACLRLGSRMAEAGEFSLRALANKRIDLSEAEAIRDLINARTNSAARQAIRQLSGEFSHRLQPIKDQLLDQIVVLESALEFVEDDLPDVQAASVTARLKCVAASLERLAATFEAGRLVRDGLRVALIGRPNVGKSSVFNALVGTDHAIVTDMAGTTRDQIRETFSVDGIPVALIDTAGLRETRDAVEQIGVERSRRTMIDADVVVVVIDASNELSSGDLEILQSVVDLNHIIAFNKIDLLLGETSAESLFGSRIASIRSTPEGAALSTIALSAKTGKGVELLRHAMVERFSAEDISNAGFLVTDARHFDLLTRAAGEIRESVELLSQKMSEEIVLVGLHNAIRFLGEITGETTSEDMLTRIFSTFCIGK